MCVYICIYIYIYIYIYILSILWQSMQVCRRCEKPYENAQGYCQYQRLLLLVTYTADWHWHEQTTCIQMQAFCRIEEIAFFCKAVVVAIWKILYIYIYIWWHHICCWWFFYQWDPSTPTMIEKVFGLHRGTMLKNKPHLVALYLMMENKTATPWICV